MCRSRRHRHKGCSTLRILARSRDFYSPTASLEYLAQSWWVLTGISALGDRSTFMPARKKDSPDRCHNLKRKIIKTTDLIKDSLNHSSWQRGFLQSDPKIVKIVVVKKREESQAEKEDLSSFEAMMLPHLNAAHNLAKWLLRNEQNEIGRAHV